MKPESQSWNRDQKANFPKVWGLRETKRGSLFAFFTQASHAAFLLSLFLPTSSLGVFWNMRSLVVAFVYAYHLLLRSSDVSEAIKRGSTEFHNAKSASVPYQRLRGDVTHTKRSERSLLRVAKSSAEKLEKATAKLACGASVWPLCAYARCSSL